MDTVTREYLAAALTNPEEEFNLINPTDGSVIGIVKYQDVFVILHSLYISLDTPRDTSTTLI